MARLGRALWHALVDLWRALAGDGAEADGAEDEVPLTGGVAGKFEASAESSPGRTRPSTIGQLRLSRCNDTPAQKAHNRSLYLDAMGKLGTWGGEYELHLLAEVTGVRAQVWRVPAGASADRFVCGAVRGASQAERVVQLKLHHFHYSALVLLAGEARCDGGTARPGADFRFVPIPGDGNCQFLAFAYAADLAHARRLLDHVNATDPEPAGTLRADAELVAHFGLTAAAYDSDRKLAVAALDVLVARQRTALVAELARPVHEAQLDLLVLQELAETDP